MPALELLAPHLVESLKTIRLRALKEDPAAFGSSYAAESQLADTDWLERVSLWNGPTSTCRLAMDDGAPCGIIAGYLDKSDPQRAHVASMWVAPTHRRTGLGTALMDTVQAWARTLATRELCLDVTDNNAAAIRFYQRCGFTLTGTTRPYPNDPALTACEMLRPLVL